MRFSLACILFAVSGLSAETINNGERDRAMIHLHSSRKLFLDSTANLSPAQWNFKPGPDRWSIAEVAEHIALTEDFLFGYTQKLLQGAPETRTVTFKDEEVLKNMVDRSKKAQAPEPLKPSRKWANPQDAVAHFKSSRDKTIEYAEKTQDDLRHHYMVMGPNTMDAYQMLLMIAGHSERHTAQINEVKASPNYPKN
jgi:hypothetical protein